MTITHPKTPETSATRTAALWTLAAVAATANLVTSLAHEGLAANLTTGLITLAALTTLGARHRRGRRGRV
ncbi:hypothetical protein ACFSUJ_15690 [Streptomyces lusitanus]|uniref:Holin n=1 Tax=Streptomyces lusitanus TaxID=68232 RepID=A0ABU3JTF4_9ACTN|nr:hypothetical protein [Streptomyces lusitanus]